MNVSVTYRKRGHKWHIRFRAKGRKEVVKSLAGRLAEKTVAEKAAWYREECQLGRFDPWKQNPDSLPDNVKRISDARRNDRI